MQIRSSLSLALMALLPVGVLAPGCSSENTATKGQMITCTTDPGTGVILRCAPGTGDGSGSNTCQDIDEDGDGDPHDGSDDDQAGSGSAKTRHETETEDRDGDGISDDHDCDEHAGEDGSRDGLPYDVRPKLGATVRPIIDAFAEQGGQPAQIVSITMDGGDMWRLTELQAGTAFVVTQADCDHAGNRAAGRDRVTVTWKNADQTQSSDHLDIRYCD
jgi:hypothetical protein